MKTAEGSGFWGYGVYEIELRTRSIVYVNSTDTNARTVVRYDLLFQRDSHPDIRTFASDRERVEFINRNFTQLKMLQLQQSEQDAKALPCPLGDVVGQYLSDVTFVMDYLQMRFCGPSFNFYNWPVVIVADRTFEVAETGYRDALCGLIGKTVQALDVFLDTGLTFKFQDGEALTASLRTPRGSTLPEVAEYSSGKQSGIIWVSGEEPFD